MKTEKEREKEKKKKKKKLINDKEKGNYKTKFYLAKYINCL